MQLFPSLKFDLGETIEMLRETVQRFAEAKIAPQAVRDNTFPNELWRDLGELGVLGMGAE